MIPDAQHGSFWLSHRHGATGAEAPPSLKALTYGLKPVPFKRMPVSFALAILAVAGCHSYHVETTVENRTGEPIRLLEVDYPSASYGADSLAAGAEYHYRIQVDGKGQLKVLYTTAEGKAVQVIGPALAERQEGRLEIVLLPGGRAEFHPQLTPTR
jgi:hypothetical protein